MDNNKHAELIEKCMNTIKGVMRESTEDYIEGKCRTAWSIIYDSNYGGAYIARKDSTNSYLDLSRVCEANRWQDIGDVMASYSTEFYTLEQIAILMAQAILTWENNE